MYFKISTIQILFLYLSWYTVRKKWSKNSPLSKGWYPFKNYTLGPKEFIFVPLKYIMVPNVVYISVNGTY